MSRASRGLASVTGRHKGIDYKTFLRRLRPELADKILGQHTARAAILARYSGLSPSDAAEQAKDEMLIEYGTSAQCSAAWRRLQERSTLPDDDPARVVCCSDQVPAMPEDEGEPQLWEGRGRG